MLFSKLAKQRYRQLFHFGPTWGIKNEARIKKHLQGVAPLPQIFHRTEKSIHRSDLFLFLLLACKDIEVNPGPGQANKGFSIYQQNLQGQLWNNKEVLEHFINQKNKKIFGITETLLSSSTPNSFLQIRRYTFERKDRIKAGGDTGIYIKEGITYLRRNDLECDETEAIWLEIMVERGNSFLIGIMYRPPNTSKHLNKNFEQKLANILNNISLLNKETIILGDLNCNCLDNKSNVSIKDLFKLRGQKQMIKTATSIAKGLSTLIDVILTNRPDNVINVNSIISSLSDHNVIKCVRKLNNIKFNPRTIKCRDYKSYYQTIVSAELPVVNWDNLYNTPDPDMTWNKLQQILSETINRHAQLINKRVKGKPAPWLNTDVKAAMNHSDKLQLKFLKSKSNTDWNMYKTA